MQPDLKEIIDVLIENKLARTQDDIASSLGVSKQLLSDIKGGRSKLTVKHLSNLVEAYNLNPTWLLTGDGDAHSSHSSNAAIAPIDNKIGPVTIGPKLTDLLPMKAIAGDLLTQYLDTFKREAVLLPNLSFRAQFFIQVEGDSMEPVLTSGDTVVVAHCMPDEVVNGKIYVVHTTDGEIVVKQVVADSIRRIYMLISLNAGKYLPFSKEEHEIVHFFRVLGKYIPLV